MKRLAVITTHPIQYNAPWLKLLHDRGNVQLQVFYTWESMAYRYDPGFEKNIEWDIPLLEGYPYTFTDITEQKVLSRLVPSQNGLVKRVRAWNPDAILVIGWRYKHHFACMRYFKNKIPVLFRGDSTLLDESGLLTTIARRCFLRWIYSYADFALYTGTNNRDYFNVHGFKDHQLIAALHAIDNDRFGRESNEISIQVQEFKKDLNIRSDQFVVLFAGKLLPKKNPDFILSLAKQIGDPDFVFLLVGNGKLEEELKAKSAGDNRIRFLDFQNQSRMPAVYRLAHVYILPSKGPGETWGLALNEAMACGLPVIASNKVGGAIDLIKDNGLIFGSDTEEVVNYLKNLKKSHHFYEITKENSIRVIQKFNFIQISEGIERACGI